VGKLLPLNRERDVGGIPLQGVDTFGLMGNEKTYS